MRADRIRRCLEEALEPESLIIEDQSDRHQGHLGWREEGETHFHVTVQSAKLAGKSRVEKHRTINHLLASEFDSGLHALSIKILPNT